MVKPSLSSAEVAGGRRVLELRHVPIALVYYKYDSGAGAIWMEAERGRVLTPEPPPPEPSGGGLPEPWWLALTALGTALSALLLPLPLSLLVLTVSVLAFGRALEGRSSVDRLLRIGIHPRFGQPSRSPSGSTFSDETDSRGGSFPASRATPRAGPSDPGGDPGPSDEGAKS